MVAESVQLTAKLHPGQAAIYNSSARFKVVAAGRRFGKSHYAAVVLGQEAMRKENARGFVLTPEHGVYYVAPTADQARRVMWPKLRQILGFAGKRTKTHPTGGLIVNENVNDGWIELVSGRRIYIKGADDPDRLRGIGLSFVVLDEFADMKPSTWTEIIEPALMDVEGSALFIGTPKGKNHFYKLFMGALEKPAHPETGNNDHWKDWEAFHFKSTDNPYLTKRELDRQMNDPNKSREVIRQELNASFISGGSKVLKPDDFELVKRLPADAFGHPVITVDFAGFKKQDGGKILKSDETVIVTTLVVNEVWYVLNMQHGHWGVRETAANIARSLRAYPGVRLGMESGALANAVGPYLDDYMREFNTYVTPEPLKHGNTRKEDRIAWALQGRSQRGLIKLIEADWNAWFLDQVADFPDPLAHDDGPDALAYVDQMARTSYVDPEDLPEHEILDQDTGY